MSEHRSAVPRPPLTLLWKRELTAQIRDTRLSHSLTIVAATLLLCTGGFTARTIGEPADIGWLLFQGSFTVAWAVVTWVAPSATAATLQADCENGGWDLFVLSPLSPRSLVWSKFVGALSWVGSYWLALLPTFALPCLFGGVSLVEVILGWGLVLAWAAVMVALCLALSSPSLAEKRRGWPPALAIPVFSAAIYLGAGIGFSILAHHTWPEVPSGAPLWLPTAWSRMPFDGRAVVTLLYAPLVSVPLLIWLFLELAIVRFSESSESALGLRAWFIATLPLIAGLLLIPRFGLTDRAKWLVSAVACAALCLHALLIMLAILGDRIQPTRRQDLAGETFRGPFKRMAKPGLSNGLASILGATAVVLAGIVGLECLTMLTRSNSGGRPSIGLWVVGEVALYGIAFTTFLFGFARFLRGKGRSPLLTRGLVLSVCFAATFVPLALAGIADGFVDHGTSTLFLAAPSPGFPFLVAQQLLAGESVTQLVGATVFALCFWTALGVRLWTVKLANLQTPPDTSAGASS